MIRTVHVMHAHASIDQIQKFARIVVFNFIFPQICVATLLTIVASTYTALPGLDALLAPKAMDMLSHHIFDRNYRLCAERFAL